MSPNPVEQLEVAAISAGIIGSVFAADWTWHRLIRLRRTGAQTATVPAAPSASAPAPAPNSAEETAMAHSGSWLNRYLFGPIKDDLAAFFSSKDPTTVVAQQAVLAVGTTALQAVNPVFDVAETALETIINTALDSLGAAGKAAELLVVDPTYQLLAAALKSKIDEKLGIAQALAAQAATTTATTAAADGYAAPKTS